MVPGKLHRLFVYGTLMRGEANHHLMEGATFLAIGLTRATFQLVSLGAYPAILADGTTAVTGEIYQVPAGLIPVLDELEGHPTEFARTALTLADGSPAEAYVLVRPPAGAEPIRSGDWRQRAR